MKRALLLNSDYTPLHFISDWRAIRLLMNGRAHIVSNFETGVQSVWDEAFTSVSQTIYIPATLRLNKYVHKKWKAPRFRKKVLFNRDGWKCQYCGVLLNWANITIDHVLPSSRGGATSWLNCATACRPCNRKKDDRTPEEAGMKLLKKPTNPTALHFWDALKTDCWHDDWNSFIPRE